MGDRIFRSNLFVRGLIDADELTVGGVPVLGSSGGGNSGIPLTNGETFYVDSGHANASDNNDGGSPDRPMATIDAAVGKCTASRGDVILVAPGHAETIAAAAGIDLDVAGISVIGMGQGELRPTITFATSTGADVDVDAANILIDNILFKCNIDSQTLMIDVNSTDCTIRNCEFREGTSKQYLTAIDVNGGSANACDRVSIYGNKFFQTAAGGAQAIELGEVADEVKIFGNLIYGDWTAAGIHNPTGKTLTDLQIVGNLVRNLNTGNHAIELVSACTGLCADNRLFADTANAILDPGSLLCTNNLAQMAIDKPGFAVPLDTEDQVTNLIGVDDADNAAATTNVAANEDGSVLERLEQIQEATNKGTGTALAANESLVDVLYGANGIVTFPAAAAPANGVSLAEVARAIYDRQLGDGTSTATNGRLGKKVSKTAATLPASTTQDIFTVSGGRVLVTLLTGEVTTIVQAQACNLSVVHVTTVGGDVTLASAVDINADEVGTLYNVEGDGTALVPVSSGTVFAAGSFPMVLAEGTMNITTSATNTGATSWELWYFPLDDGATVASA